MGPFPFPLEPHTAIITGRTGCGKTQFALDLLEGPFRGALDYIFILCPTVRDNLSYRNRPWIWADPHIAIIDPTDTGVPVSSSVAGRDRLHDWIRGLSKAFRGDAVLFLLDDVSATKSIKLKHNALSELAFSGRHRGHSLWLLTQKWNSVCTDVRENTQWVAAFACKDRDSFEEVLRDNDVVPPSEKAGVKEMLAKHPHARLLIRTAWPECYQVLH